MQNIQIKEVDSHKYLGIFLSNDCNWHQHIKASAEKARFRINIMNKLKFKLDRKSLATIYIIYKTIIRIRRYHTATS